MLYLVLLVIMLAAGSGAVATPLSRRLEVIPEPREVVYQGEPLAYQKAMEIRVSDTKPDLFAADLLIKALRELGVTPSMTLLPSGSTHTLTVTASETLPAIPPSVSPEQAAEGYNLLVEGSGINLTARSEAGLFYGVQTIIQLVQQAGRERGAIPGMVIRDWPEFEFRSASYIEGSQAKSSVLVSKAELEQTIKRLAMYKMNALVVEIYNLAPLASFPACANANTLSRADWKVLVEVGRRYHVIIVPSMMSFGQMADIIWNCDEGIPYRESTCQGLLCPSRPENIEFLKGLYKDLLEIFPNTPYLGIGCSEVWMQWNKNYCPKCQARIDAGETEWDIYTKHVQKCADGVSAVAKQMNRDVRPLMWADEFYMYNSRPRYEGLEKMPKQMVMGHWQYFDKYWVLENRHYDGIEGMISRGYDVMWVSACWPSNTFLVDLSPEEPTADEGKFPLIVDSGVLNIVDQARYAYEYRAKGLPGKVLGGLCATFSQHDIRCWDTTWLGYALQGDYTWGDPTRPWAKRKNVFVHDYAASFYGPRDAKSADLIAQAFLEIDAVKSDIERNHYLIRDIIGEYDAADASYTGNSLEQSGKLIRELMAAPPVEGKTVADIRARAEKARLTAIKWRGKLAALEGSVSNTTSLGYLKMAAHKMVNHAERTLLLLDIEAALAVPGGKPEIAALQTRLTALTDDTRGILDEMSKLTWFTDDYATGYYLVMDQLDGLQKRLSEASK
ncbi:MAG: glycoside hydrolase family 20 zincin-like fold domain-containing protein [Armatimonadota bacterium]